MGTFLTLTNKWFKECKFKMGTYREKGDRVSGWEGGYIGTTKQKKINK